MRNSSIAVVTPNRQKPAEAISHVASSPWLSDSKPDLRRLTVLVRSKPPADLAAKFLDIAQHNQRMQAFFRAAAEGGFGSGFVVVRRMQEPSGAFRHFIVTNRHVVELANSVTVAFQGESQEYELPVVYVDPSYDLALLSLDVESLDAALVTRLAPLGFDFEATPATDQQPVVASGYPAIGQEPSYQVSRGYVSNERFEIAEGGRALRYVQHTAPIDPGSSGGPLTTESGKLLGINTMKVRRRENVGLAVPAPVVERAIENAIRSESERQKPGDREAASGACRALLVALGSGDAGLEDVERAIGAPMLVRDGFSSLDALPSKDGTDWLERFLESPTQVFLTAVAMRLIDERPKPDARMECKFVEPEPTDGAFAFDVPTRRGQRRWTFAWEQRRFKLVRASLDSTARNERSFGITASQRAVNGHRD
ncbi:MAG: serine protease [Anaeromyxobacter sp.]